MSYIAPVAVIAAAMIATTASAGVPVTLPSRTQLIDQSIGTGAIAQPGRMVTVHYSGWLYVNGKRGRKFDSSRDHGGEPFSFALGAGEVIKGWDEGVAGMKVGGKRVLIIPPAAGYGAQGDDEIPANSWLIFDVELVRVE